MSARPDDETQTTAAFDALAAPHRRYLLTVLFDGVDGQFPASSNTVPIETLATDVASELHGHPVVTDDQCDRIHLSLVHLHLPRLEDRGIVTREERDGTTVVSLADHSLLEREWVRSLLDDPTGGTIGDEEVLNRTLEALTSARRRTICSVLARQRGGVSLIDLATLVAAREGDEKRRLTDVTGTECTNVATELAHSHVPALVEAGLVEYDRGDGGDGTVEIVPDAPQWHADWLAASPLGEIADLLERDARRVADPASVASGATSRPGACWTIDGAENVVARGHEIADAAEEELFVTVPDDGMLHQRCLDRWSAAADRGVDVYVGSRCACVRETVREAVPEATVCEPRFDWINFPTDHLHHGRVVFADRDHVMLVTIDESADATAITADGPRNALVSLVREHLGPRLDRLEAERDEGEKADGTMPLPM